MIIRQLWLSCEPRPITIDGTNYTKAAGQGTYVSSPIDTQGYQAVAIITVLGTVTSTSVVTQTVQDSLDNAVTDSYSNLILPFTSTGVAGSGTTASYGVTSPTSFSEILWDIYEPLKRYLQVTTVVGTANCQILYLIALLFNANQSPVTMGTLVNPTWIELNSPADAKTV